MDLPDELLLIILSHLPLTSLIASRGVCKLWRTLVPGSQIPTYRRGLLELYLRAIDSPAFLATRKEILGRTHAFNRAAYIDSLPQGIPDDFRCWLHEWPERAVIGLLWPGVRDGRHAHSKPDLFYDTGHAILSMTIFNRIAFQSPLPGMMQAFMYFKDVEGESGAALLLDDAFVEGQQRSRVLLLSGTCEGAEMKGRVYNVDGVKCPMESPVATSWTQYLQQELSREDLWLKNQ
ncbi:uncharacterized protein PHACADRAFT_29141 [Phanerochaete carnosa HHB-10118-sp]|uniref:F-box domain-containing protein n=1 Tax=Phanerochaete carnosa (strain HHB-10118-sp) TaxID=650164 RepID=K5VX93_PHACS|nr:uncharacterized protein PHACADRAFT_29141 [Phanerochaete carnosa HHB-10118-sp]EKM56198.1 hypothetical protein PHACADRAFT_29141 [Phanerochaete carnosa HHB-10118-sp]